MSSAGSLWVEILPKFVGTRAAMQADMVPSASAVGAEAGQAIARGVEDGAKAGAAGASASIRTAVVESAKISAAEANAILANVGSGTLGKQLAAEMKAAESAVAASAQRMQAANEKAVQATQSVELAERRLAEARSKYAADSSQVVAAENRLADAERKSALAAEEVKASTAASASAQSTYVASRNKVSEAEESGKLKTAEAEAAQGKLSNTMKAAIPGMASVSEGYSKMGAVIGGVLVVAMGEKAVKAAGDFQSSQERLVTTAGEVQKNLDMVSQGVLKMAGEVGISAQDLSKGMYTVESAGFHGADGLTVMKAAAQGAKAENADLTTVTDAVTSAMQDYHLKAADAGLVTSKLITAVSDGKTTFQDLTGAMSSVLPVASSVGVSMNEVLGDLSSMTLHGMSADQAAQNLANSIRSLANPTAASTKELAALGLNAADLSKDLGKNGVQGTMEEISQAILQKMGPAGTTLLNSFNQSKQAASDAATMFGSLPPKLQGVAKEFQDGKISMNDWRQGLKALPADQAALLTQWVNMQNSAHGFSDALKTGGNASQTYSQALAKATGNSTSMNVALMLTGENAEKTKQNIADVGKATTEAGGNTKGWAEVQQTFNQKMAEAKASMGALVIQVGTALLPVVSALATAFGAVVGWMTQHQGLSKALIISFGAIALAIAIATVAMIAFNSAVWSNPVTWIVAAIILAIGLLVVGVYELVTHWKQIWAAIAAAASAVYHAVIKPVFDGIAAAFHVIAVAATWLWQNILEPVFSAISLAVRILIAIIYTVLVLPWVILFKNVLAPVFSWLYNSVIKPVFDGIAIIFHWIYDNVIKPVFDAIGAAFHWIYENIIRPIVFGIKLEIQAFGDVIHWLYDHAIKPVFDAVGAVFHWIYENIIKPIVAGIKIEIQAWADVFSWLYDHIIKPIGAAIGDAFHGIGQAVSNVVDWIKSTWEKVQDIVKVPAKFVVQTVYDDAIVPVWNGIAGVFGLGKINPVDVSHWAGGGILPGYQPGVDSIPAMLSPGEAVLTPEAAMMLGHSNIMQLNAMSGRPSGNISNGMPIHAAGGFFDWVGGIAGDVGHFVSGAASSLWDSLKDVGGWIAKGVEAVAGSVTSLFSGATNAANATPGPDNDFKKSLTSIPSHVIKAAIDKIKSIFSNFMGGGAGVIPVGEHLAIIDAALTADGIPRGDWPRWEAGLNTLITRESGWNSSIMNMWDSNAAAGHPSGGLAQMILPTFESNRNPSLPNNMLDPVANVASAITYIIRTYGDISRVQQANANLPAKGYDSGGFLQPGVTAVVNASGRPEPVFSAGQWDVLKGNLHKVAGSGERHYHITSHDPTSVVHELERRERAEMSAKLI